MLLAFNFKYGEVESTSLNPNRTLDFFMQKESEIYWG